ncbi:hypothetical protein C6Y50_06740 [Stutzerimonas stutzeri]|nr:hypothetical protein C6Y50_06740 [Stutzerimonas stutzeri]
MMMILLHLSGVVVMINRVIHHQRFNEAVDVVYDAYIRCLEEEPVIQPVFGLSGVGKTFSIKLLTEKIRAGGEHEVLVVEFPPIRSYRAVIDECLMVFKLSPRAYKNEALALEGLRKQVESRGVKLIIFDEAQNLLERKVGIDPKAMGDTIKHISNKCGVSIAVYGLPDAERLFKGDDQLARRSMAPFYFYPYEWVGAEFKCFRNALGASIQYLHSLDIETFKINDLDFAKRMYVASSGRIAFSEKLIKEVVRMKVKSAFLEEFEMAYKRASYSLLLGSNPFAPDAKISDQDMAMSYTSAMDQARAYV